MEVQVNTYLKPADENLTINTPLMEVVTRTTSCAEEIILSHSAIAQEIEKKRTICYYNQLGYTASTLTCCICDVAGGILTYTGSVGLGGALLALGTTGFFLSSGLFAYIEFSKDAEINQHIQMLKTSDATLPDSDDPDQLNEKENKL